MTEDELIEALAEKEHASWARWMAYLFSRCTKNQDGSFTIFTDFAERWGRQIATPYSDLSEQEKQSDRDEVAHILPIIEEYVNHLVRTRLEELLHWALDAKEDRCK